MIERDDLIDMVRRGELTPDSAELEAEKLQIEPLSRSPDPANFDPMKEPWWTVPMTLAWICWRSASAVREAWPRYAAECWHWLPDEQRMPDLRIVSGHVLVQRRRPTLSQVSIRAGIQGKSEDFGRAEQEFRLALSEARIDGFGIDRSSGERVSIPPRDWRDINLGGESSEVGVRPSTAGAGTSYVDVVVLSRSPIALWPTGNQDLGDASPIKSGFPGRPTSKTLIEAEFERRAERKEVCPVLMDEGRLLSAWLEKAHPTAPRVTAKTIANCLRPAHRLLAPENKRGN